MKDVVSCPPFNIVHMNDLKPLSSVSSEESEDELEIMGHLAEKSTCAITYEMGYVATHLC